MAKYHEPIVVKGVRNLTLGTVIGTRVTRDIYDEADRDGHRVFFGGRFDDIERELEERFIRPLDSASITLERVTDRVMNPDRWRVLESIDDFRRVPPSMEIVVATAPSVRRLIEEGRVDGYGYDPESLPKDDYYGRIADNYRTDDVLAVMDDVGHYPIHAVHRSTDDDLTADQKHLLWKTRRNIARWVETSDRDITDPDTLRG